MRKFKFFLLALIATVFLTGCGNDKGADTAKAASNEADAIAKIKERGYVRIGYFQVLNGRNSMEAGDTLKIPRVELRPEYRSK